MTFARFTVAYWCFLVAALLPLVCAGMAKFGLMDTQARGGRYDNNNPRAWLARQSGWRARADAAQANTFEALPFFFAAVLVAHQLQAPQTRLDILALLFIVLRMGYVLMYIADMSRTRSSLWAAALLVNIGILFSGYR